MDIRFDYTTHSGRVTIDIVRPGKDTVTLTTNNLCSAFWEAFAEVLRFMEHDA